jgi:hypothetical protein
MRLDEACEPAFARHETFHPRLGWFRKAFLAASKDKGGFYLSQDAPVRLGVGKNMVRSIRFWGSAAHLITDVVRPNNPRLANTKPTNFGVALLGPNGLDPLMEHNVTWWWLHWMMLAPGCKLPVWWLLLNEMHAVEFDEDLAHRVCVEALSASPWETPHPSSVQKDILAFFRTYATGRSGPRGKFDDQFGCQLRDLRLLAASPTGYRLATGRPRDLPGEVVVAALLDFVSLTSPTVSTASVARLATTPGGPGRALRLSEEMVVELITPVVEKHRSLSLTAPAGAVQLGWRGNPATLAQQLLCRSFGSPRVSVPPLAGPEARAVNVDPVTEVMLIQESLELVL